MHKIHNLQKQHLEPAALYAPDKATRFLRRNPFGEPAGTPVLDMDAIRSSVDVEQEASSFLKQLEKAMQDIESDDAFFYPENR